MLKSFHPSVAFLLTLLWNSYLYHIYNNTNILPEIYHKSIKVFPLFLIFYCFYPFTLRLCNQNKEPICFIVCVIHVVCSFPIPM